MPNLYENEKNNIERKCLFVFNKRITERRNCEKRKITIEVGSCEQCNGIFNMSGGGALMTLLCGVFWVCRCTMWECICVRFCFIVVCEVCCGVVSKLCV